MLSNKIIYTFTFLLCLLFALSTFGANISSDAQIAEILTTTNNNEIALAKVAKENAKNNDVKRFAENVIIENLKNNKKTMKLSKKLKTSPTENEINLEAKKSGEQALFNLNEYRRDEEFDKSYMSMQIYDHQKALEDFNTTLIPSAKNTKLKKLLEKSRDTVARRLQEARRIHQKL